MNVPMSVIRWAAVEVERQHDTPEHVVHMLSAWHWASNNRPDVISVEWLERVAAIVKPHTNSRGLRRCEVSFASGGEASSAEHVGRLTHQLCIQSGQLGAYEFTHRLLKIHPWADGNGRTACIVYNVLKNNPWDEPVALPEFQF